MNPALDPLQVQLDRLVDGELSPAEYRALLLALDADPQGWKRCATAFLEAQALRSELPTLCDEGLPSTDAPAASSPTPDCTPARAPRWKTALGWVGALAAGFLLALPLGPWLTRWTGKPKAQPVAQHDGPVAPSPDKASLASSPRAREPLGNVSLVAGGREVQVPLFALDDRAESLWSEQALPDELLEFLRAQGHQVQHLPQVVPMELDDGRQVLLPIDRYRIEPVHYRLVQ